MAVKLAINDIAFTKSESSRSSRSKELLLLMPWSCLDGLRCLLFCASFVGSLFNVGTHLGSDGIAGISINSGLGIMDECSFVSSVVDGAS